MKHLFIPALAAGLITLLSWGTCPGDTPHPPAPAAYAAYKDAVLCGRITSLKLPEVSGITVSRKTPGLLWVINDSSNPAAIYGLSTKGELLKSYKIEGAINWDWEDLAGFRYKEEDFLVIADVGDNWSARPFSTLYCVKEPAADNQSETLELEWKMNFSYENGPLDCEAVAVDAAHQKIYLLSKRTAVPILYELPLDMDGKKFMYTARAVATIKPIPGPIPKNQKQAHGKYRSHPTAMDISADGNTLYILTYKHAYAYSRTPDQTWDQAFSRHPLQITLPDRSKALVQREALGLDHTSGKIFITTEKIPAPIYVVEPTSPAAH
nr:SdiA-regulated domain-containing protein [uncultured Desulfobacter sp.]